MSIRAWAVLALLALVSGSACAAEEAAAKTTSFTQAVITKAISVMPEDLKTKLSPVEKDILSVAKPTPSGKQPAKEVYYFVEKQDGAGPTTLVDQFRAVRKKVAEKASYSTLAPLLGKLAATIIALSEPYHTSDTAFKGKAHADFEKALDTSAASLKAESDGNQKVTNPSDFAVKIAKQASDVLSKADSSETQSQTEAKTTVFSLAVNSVADCWWTLLSVEKPKTEDASSSSPGDVPTDGNFIGNVNSLKFHLPTCRYLPAEKNRVYFKTRDEAVSQGYIACKVCKP